MKSAETDDRSPSSAHAARYRRELRLARVALGLYGLDFSPSGAQGFEIVPLKRRNYKSLFLVRSPDRGAFSLHMYRTPIPPEDSLRSPEYLRSQDGRSLEAALRSQLLWMEVLQRETELSVPEPLRTLDGSFTSHVSLGDTRAPRRCVLLRWLPGRSKEGNPRPADFARIGSCIARMDRQAEAFTAPHDFLRPRWDWGYVFGKAAPFWRRGKTFYSEDEMAVFRAAAERTADDLRALGEGRDVFGVIHNDLLLQNFVFHKKGIFSRRETVSVIDFDLCGWGHYLYALARPLKELRLRYGDHAAPLQAALLEGYQRERSLPRDHWSYLETFTSMRTVELVNRVLSWESPSKEPWGRRLLPEAVEELKRYVEAQ